LKVERTPAAASEPEAAEMVRQIVAERIFRPVVEALGVDDAPLTMARYVVRVEPLASAESAAVVAAIAPTRQRYLVEPTR
jgi:hypothetical protein